MRKIGIIAVLSLMALALAAVPALAQGMVEQGTDQANSICSFSGLNDVPDDPVEGGRVQSYGQAVSQGGLDPTDRETVERPGVLCNAHLFPYPEAFPPEPE
jgi:hypothetical protein